MAGELDHETVQRMVKVRVGSLQDGTNGATCHLFIRQGRSAVIKGVKRNFRYFDFSVEKGPEKHVVSPGMT